MHNMHTPYYLVLVFDGDLYGLGYNNHIVVELKIPLVILKHICTLNHRKDICIAFLLYTHTYLTSFFYFDSSLSISVLYLVSRFCFIFYISYHWACQAHPNWHHLIDWDLWGRYTTCGPLVMWDERQVGRSDLECMFHFTFQFLDMGHSLHYSFGFISLCDWV